MSKVETLLDRIRTAVEDGELPFEELKENVDRLIGDSFYVWKEENKYIAQTGGKYTELFKDHFSSRDDNFGIPDDFRRYTKTNVDSFEFDLIEFVEAFGHAQTISSLGDAVKEWRNPWHQPTTQFIKDLEELGETTHIASWIRLTHGIGSHNGVSTLVSDIGYEPLIEKIPRKFISKTKKAKKHPLPLVDLYGDDNRNIELSSYLIRPPNPTILANPTSAWGEHELKDQPYYAKEMREIHIEHKYGDLL